MADRTKVLSVHRLRRTARKREREITLNGGKALDTFPAYDLWRASFGLPEWARGVRVEKAGLFQYCVVATEHRGH